MATIDRIATSRVGAGAGAGDWPRQQLPPSGREAPWQGYWFTPATGLRPRPLEVLLVAAVAFIQVAGTASYSGAEPARWAGSAVFDPFALVLLSVGPLALLFRRRWPEATLAVTLAAAAVYTATDYPRGPGGTIAFVVALVTAIVMGRRAFAWGVVVVAFVAFTLLPSLNPDEVDAKLSVASSALNVAGWLPLLAAGSELARIRLERRAEWARAERATPGAGRARSACSSPASYTTCWPMTSR